MIVRPTARLVVLDPEGRVLLFKIEDHTLVDPADPRRPRIFWITPGGGVEDGETFEVAALRELREETGLAPTALGPCVVERDILLHEHGQDILFRTRFFLVHTATTDVSLHGQSEPERADYRDHRWWCLGDIERTKEVVFPDELLMILRRALAAS